MDASYLAVVTLTLMLTVTFSLSIASFDIYDIKTNWATRRCEVPTMLAAAWFKPADDKRTSNEFAQENFNFCMSKLANELIQSMFGPLYKVAEQQSQAQETVQGPLNNVRGMIRTGMESFSGILREQYRKFSFLALQSTRVWKHLEFAFQRINAIVISVVYLGLSMSATIQNMIDFTLNTILIFIGIMVALIILLWFVLFPFIPIILTVLTILVGAGIGAAGSMAGAFCIDPDALVVMSDKSYKPLHSIQVGDILLGDKGSLNKVEGILTADTNDVELVEIDGIVMSGSHRVFYEKEWILARNHKAANPVKTRLPRLICLNTSQHIVYIVGNTRYLPVGDWEEVTTEEGRRAWIEHVHTTLNGRHSTVVQYPTAPPLLSSTVKVKKEGVGWVSASAISIGDRIQAGEEYTTVKGIYRGQIPTDNEQTRDDWMSDGVWIQNGLWWSTLTEGVHVNSTPESLYIQGIFFVTEKDVFTVLYKDVPTLVRDFTELGTQNLESSYGLLDMYLKPTSQSTQ